MRSPEGSQNRLGRLSVPTVLSVLALGACVDHKGDEGDEDGEVIQIQGASVKDVGATLGAETRHGMEAWASTLTYDDPLCAHVRSTKEALNALDDPSKERERAKRGRSGIIDTRQTRGADGSRSYSRSQAWGSGTPDDVRTRTETLDRFLDASRAAGGIQRATEICLKRSGTRNR